MGLVDFVEERLEFVNALLLITDIFDKIAKFISTPSNAMYGMFKLEKQLATL